MARDDTTDIVAAFLIGAALGVGATLLLRDDDGSELARLLQGVRRRRGRPARMAAAVRDRGEDIVGAGRRMAATLREDAADIVASARDEIRALAADGVRRVRKVRDR